MSKIFYVFKSLKKDFGFSTLRILSKNSVCFERTVGKIRNKDIPKKIVITSK